MDKLITANTKSLLVQYSKQSQTNFMGQIKSESARKIQAGRLILAYSHTVLSTQKPSARPVQFNAPNKTTHYLTKRVTFSHEAGVTSAWG